MKISLLSPRGFLHRKQASKKWGWCSSNLASQNLPDLGDIEEEDPKEPIAERFLKLPFLE
jgi:hypothetical protein